MGLDFTILCFLVSSGFGLQNNYHTVVVSYAAHMHTPRKMPPIKGTLNPASPSPSKSIPKGAWYATDGGLVGNRVMRI